MTLDGKISTRTGDSRWISNPASRRRVHQLRGRMDALLVGIGTALADDPLLTVRPPGPRTPARIVLDSQGRLPLSGQLAQTARTVPVLIATSSTLEDRRREELQALGCEWLPLPGEAGLLSLPALLDELGHRRMTNILVEGGSAVLGSFFDARALDEVHVFLAPRLLGGAQAKTPVGGRGVDQMAQALFLTEWEVETIEGDLYLHGWNLRSAGPLSVG